MIQVPRDWLLVTVAAQPVGTLGIQHNEDDVGLCHSRLTQVRNYRAYPSEKHPGLTV